MLRTDDITIILTHFISTSFKQNRYTDEPGD